MTLREWLNRGEEQLSAGTEPERARRDAETLLLHHLGKSRAWLMAHADDDFAGCVAIRYADMLDHRQKGEPIQYITGQAEFYGLPFCVTPDVLIPRPETEHLVEVSLRLTAEPLQAQPQTPGAPVPALSLPTGLAFETWESNEPKPGAPPLTRTLDHGWETESARTPRIADIGTGSGVIAVALAHHLPHAAITATDLSTSALSLAEENAKRNGVALRFLQGDLLAPVTGEVFDLIVSNPPYVPASDRDTLAVEVRDYEPHLALFAGDDGLDLYRRLIPACFAALAPGGWLALEIGHGQADAVHALLHAAGFTRIQSTPDLQGIPRVLAAQRA